MKHRRLYAVLLSAGLFILSIITMQTSFSRFLHTAKRVDSVWTDAFNVKITAPKDFAEDGKAYEHYFLSESHNKTLYFQVENLGNAEVICTPHITAGIQYHVFVLGTETPSFVVEGRETVAFEVVVQADGLGTDITEALLYVDVKQKEGG